MQGDGNCVMYDTHGGGKKAIWCTRTDGGQMSPKFGEGDKLTY